MRNRRPSAAYLVKFMLMESTVVELSSKPHPGAEAKSCFNGGLRNASAIGFRDNDTIPESYTKMPGGGRWNEHLF
jgi:hypothetical protein